MRIYPTLAREGAWDGPASQGRAGGRGVYSNRNKTVFKQSTDFLGGLILGGWAERTLANCCVNAVTHLLSHPRLQTGAILPVPFQGQYDS